MHVGDEKKDFLVLGKVPAQSLDNTKITSKTKYAIAFTRPGRRFVLSSHYNGSNSF